MAPLRSSRNTRHRDHGVTDRTRGGVLDLDPMDGLPVQKWSQMTVRINQEASSGLNGDPASTLGSKSTNSAEWAAQFETPQFPWKEQELPTFFKELPVWNQEMIRRARAGNTAPRLSVYDRKARMWISAAEAEKKAQHTHKGDLGDTKPDDASTKSDSDDENSDQDSDTSSRKSDAEESDDMAVDEPFKRTTRTSKRRKLATRGHLSPRTFTSTRWGLVPSTVADKVNEPKFLADRRPGMPPLYHPEYSLAMFGQYLSNNVGGLGGVSYDLGDGGGLGNATGMMGGDGAAAAPTPPRRNIPPKRKKKKLGGPGRRPKNWNANAAAAAEAAPTPATGNAAQSGEAAAQNVGSADTATANTSGNDVVSSVDPTATSVKAEGEENQSDESEGEGSEEGEIDEGNNTQVQTEQRDGARPAAPPPPTAPETTAAVRSEGSQEDTEMPDSAPAPAPRSANATMAPITQPLSAGIIDHGDPANAVAAAKGEQTDENAGASVVAAPAESNTEVEPPTGTTPQPIPEKTTADGILSEIAAGGEIVSEQAVPSIAPSEAPAPTKTEELGEGSAGAKEEKAIESADGPAGELDLLGGLDAAIDEGMKE